MAQRQLVWLITGTTYVTLLLPVCLRLLIYLPSSGIGRELVLNVLSRGDKVVATARSLQKLDELKQAGADILELDVVSPLQSLHEVVKEAHGLHGRIDVLVNNAGILF